MCVKYALSFCVFLNLSLLHNWLLMPLIKFKNGNLPFMGAPASAAAVLQHCRNHHGPRFVKTHAHTQGVNVLLPYAFWVHLRPFCQTCE